MNRFKLHHIGILMPTIEQAKAFCDKFGLDTDYYGYVDIYHADCIMMKSRQDETPIEIIIPRGGILKEFNNGKGGLHHIAFQVPDLKQVQQEYELQGLHMLEKQAVPGNGNILVNYLRPRYGEGVLAEFVQEL